MPDYFHSALRGEQIHEAKIKVLPESSPFPVPDWEGQFLVIGLKLYVSIKQDNVLTWLQPKAYNLPQLPANVVTFERNYGLPPANSGSGVIYTNLYNGDNYYLSLGQWFKLGPVADSNSLLILPSHDFEFNLPVQGQMTAALLKQWELNKKYYFKLDAPHPSSFASDVTTNYFIELRYANRILADNVLDGLITLDTLGVQSSDTDYKLMIYFKKMYYSSYEGYAYCNFSLDLQSRLITIHSLASIYFD